MIVVLAPQGNAATLVVVPHPDYVEVIASAPLLDEPALLSAMEHLKLALGHHPRKAAILEMIAPSHDLDAAHFAPRWDGVLADIQPLTKLAIVISCAEFDFSRLTHSRGAFLRLFASRRAAMRWFEQAIQLPVPGTSRSGHARGLAKWWFGTRRQQWSAAAGRTET